MCTPLWRGTMAVYRFLASALSKIALLHLMSDEAVCAAVPVHITICAKGSFVLHLLTPGWVETDLMTSDWVQ